MIDTEHGEIIKLGNDYYIAIHKVDGLITYKRIDLKKLIDAIINDNQELLESLDD